MPIWSIGFGVLAVFTVTSKGLAHKFRVQIKMNKLANITQLKQTLARKINELQWKII